MNDKIRCEICSEMVHHIGTHLTKDHHGEVTLEQYQERYPGALLMSELFRAKLEERKVTKVQMAVGQSSVISFPNQERKETLQSVFRLGNLDIAKNARGEDIQITVVNNQDHADMIPDEDSGYVFNIETLKAVLFALEENIPTYLWGHAGVGKTQTFDQVCAFTKRPISRVQHTLNMVESDVVGDWRAKDGNTYFDLGPLPYAMIHGLTYLADEYDRAPPGVISLYQAVLEGKPLTIKEAPPEHRTIRPHRNFRFVATGNTNGSGDEHGLYAGTLIQDAASFSRFGVTLKINYMDAKSEIAILRAKTAIKEEDAKDLIRWASMIRESFESGKIGATVSPRELLFAARVGVAFHNMRKGIELAMTNRFNDVDREIASEISQRIFGG